MQVEVSDWARERIAEPSDEWMAALSRSLVSAVEELDDGKGIPLTPETIEDIKRRGRERLAAGQNHS